MTTGPVVRSTPVRLGFGTIWERPPEPTWSYIPWSLRAALRAQCDVVDVGLDLDPWQLAALKASHLRHVRGRQRSSWRFSRTLFRLAQRSFEAGAERAACDAVLQAMPLAQVRNAPYFVYHDAGIDALEAHRDPRTGEYPYLPGISARTTRRLREQQRAVFQGADGVFAMSSWLARSLVARTGVDPSRIHVVHPGCNTALIDEAQRDRTHGAPEDGRRNRLLFIGKAFHAKGGDLVVEAFKLLRASYDPTMTLTIAGPSSVPCELPDGVRYLGRVPLSTAASLFQTHDLFVMPSRIEPFGIVFVEALANGMPCIGRDDFEMPVLIQPGRNGDLITRDDVDELAATIVRVLEDDDVYTTCEADRAGVAARFSWQRAAEEMLGVISRA